MCARAHLHGNRNTFFSLQDMQHRGFLGNPPSNSYHSNRALTEPIVLKERHKWEINLTCRTLSTERERKREYMRMSSFFTWKSWRGISGTQKLKCFVLHLKSPNVCSVQYHFFSSWCLVHAGFLNDGACENKSSFLLLHRKWTRRTRTKQW